MMLAMKYDAYYNYESYRPNLNKISNTSVYMHVI